MTPLGPKDPKLTPAKELFVKKVVIRSSLTADAPDIETLVLEKRNKKRSRSGQYWFSVKYQGT